MPRIMFSKLPPTDEEIHNYLSLVTPVTIFGERLNHLNCKLYYIRD